MKFKERSVSNFVLNNTHNIINHNTHEIGRTEKNDGDFADYC